MENVVSNAERRALVNGETIAVPRILDIYAALPAITGKLELEYEGELKGGDAISRELIRTAVAKIYDRYFEGVNMHNVIQWFDIGGSLKMGDDVNAADMVKQLGPIQGLLEKTRALGLGANEPDAVRASAAEFILEGLLCASAYQPVGRTWLRGGRAEAPVAGTRFARRWRRTAAQAAPSIQLGVGCKVRESWDCHEVGQILEVHRRRFRDRRAGSAERAFRFLSGERL